MPDETAGAESVLTMGWAQGEARPQGFWLVEGELGFPPVFGGHRSLRVSPFSDLPTGFGLDRNARRLLVPPKRLIDRGSVASGV